MAKHILLAAIAAISMLSASPGRTETLSPGTLVCGQRTDLELSNATLLASGVHAALTLMEDLVSSGRCRRTGGDEQVEIAGIDGNGIASIKRPDGSIAWTFIRRARK